MFEHCDVGSPQLDDVMERGIAWLGGLDVLANVAGIERGATPQEVTEDEGALTRFLVSGVPVFGVNFGRVGFLSSMGRRDLE